MNNTLLTSRASSQSWDPKFPFDLVIAYEDAETRNRALQLYDRLAQQLLDDYDFQCSWWKLDQMSDNELRQDATDAVLGANMVILSLRSRPELEPEQKAWIEDWTSRRPHQKAALVVMMQGTSLSEPNTTPVLNYLQTAARRGGMDFFPHLLEPASPPKANVVPLLPNFSPVTPLLQGILYHKSPVPRWGINE